MLKKRLGILIAALAVGLNLYAAPVTNKQNAVDEAIALLPMDDQQIVKGLKFGSFEPIRFGLTHNNCDIKVTNRSSRKSITDKLTAEVRFLCKTKDKEWAVCQGKAVITVVESGTQVIHMGGLGNASVMRDHNGGQKEPYDAFVTIRYLDVPIYTGFWKRRTTAPEKWWENDALIYNK